MPIPEFKMYNPSKHYMNEKKLSFYQKVESNLKKGKHIHINGNISYVFVYLYDLLNKWKKIGYKNLSEHLIYISEIYATDKKLSDYCLIWALDCLLAQKKYLEFLDKTEHIELKSHWHHDANLRLNIQKHLGLEPDPVDVILLINRRRRSKFISSNKTLYKDSLMEVFSEFYTKNNSWYKIMKSWDKPQSRYPHWLFIGARVEGMPKLDFDICSFSRGMDLELIKELSKNAENLARKKMGVPLVGEGWVSETELYRNLAAEFNITKVVQHGRPTWLGRQHLDIWFPNWRVAIEYHGKQHFEPVDFFGGIEALEKTKERDRRKERLAKENGVELIVVTEGYSLENLINRIYEISKKRTITTQLS